MDSGCGFFLILMVVLFLVLMFSPDRDKALAAAEKARRDAELARLEAAQKVEADHLARAPINPQLICPHCQIKGSVHTMLISTKQGISGGKATAAVLNGGVSLLATGLSGKQDFTEALCDNCKSIWRF